MSAARRPLLLTPCSYEVENVAVHVGKRVPRVEGPAKVTGNAKYAADVIPPGMLWGKTLRSEHPHARIVSIDTSRAHSLPGVHAVLTGHDIPLTMVGRMFRDLPVGAGDVLGRGSVNGVANHLLEELKDRHARLDGAPLQGGAFSILPADATR